MYPSSFEAVLCLPLIFVLVLIRTIRQFLFHSGRCTKSFNSQFLFCLILREPHLVQLRLLVSASRVFSIHLIRPKSSFPFERITILPALSTSVREQYLELFNYKHSIPYRSLESHQVGFSNRGGLLSFCALNLSVREVQVCLTTSFNNRSMGIQSGLDLVMFCSSTHYRHRVITIYCFTVCLRFAQRRVPVSCFSSSKGFSTYPVYHRLNSCSLVSD